MEKNNVISLDFSKEVSSMKSQKPQDKSSGSGNLPPDLPSRLTRLETKVDHIEANIKDLKVAIIENTRYLDELRKEISNLPFKFMIYMAGLIAIFGTITSIIVYLFK